MENSTARSIVINDQIETRIGADLYDTHIRTIAVSLADKAACAAVVQSPLTTAQPLLTMQKLSLEGKSSICICRAPREAQHNYVEALRCQAAGVATEVFLLHELMTAYQRQFTLDCIIAAADFLGESGIAVFTTAACLPALTAACPALAGQACHVHTHDPAQSSPHIPRPDQDAPSVRITCICLKEGQGGRWLLSDHEQAAVVRPDITPDSALAQRLLNHCVEISGSRLAPYLAMMFDVPAAWKSHPELALCSLLIFRAGQCSTGCTAPGIPPRILWSDMLGLVY